MSEVYVCRVCRNAVVDPRSLVERIAGAGPAASGPAHRRFRIAFSGCPNGCSLPQLRDFGAMGQMLPTVTEEPCIGCGACVSVCAEEAIRLADGPVLDAVRCVKCGQCVRACPTGTLAGRTGYRVLVGGKAGRHPRWATVLGELTQEGEVVDLLNRVRRVVNELAPGTERPGILFDRQGFQGFFAAVGGSGGARTADRNVGEFLDDLGSSRVPPSAGIALALVGAVSAALVEMVGNMRGGNPVLAGRARELRQKLLLAGDRDQEVVRRWLRGESVDLNEALREMIRLGEEVEELAAETLAGPPGPAELDGIIGLRLVGAMIRALAEALAGNGGKGAEEAVMRSARRQEVHRAHI